MKKIIVIKTGGLVAVNSTELTSMINEIKAHTKNYSFILVHGGGAEVTEASKVYGLEAKFIDGVRMTTPKEMDIVDSILAGKINKRLVRNFQSLGIKAVGLSGNDGAIFISLYNFGTKTVSLKKGERVAQGIFSKFLTATNEKDVLTKRRGGFGSTGKN